MTPSASGSGARLDLLLERSEETSAIYEGTFLVAGARYRARFRIDEEGRVSDEQFADEPSGAAPAWLTNLSRALLRGAFRNRALGSPWPRRISRWRQDNREA